MIGSVWALKEPEGGPWDRIVIAGDGSSLQARDAAAGSLWVIQALNGFEAPRAVLESDLYALGYEEQTAAPEPEEWATAPEEVEK